MNSAHFTKIWIRTEYHLKFLVSFSCDPFSFYPASFAHPFPASDFPSSLDADPHSSTFTSLSAKAVIPVLTTVTMDASASNLYAA
jgi:hypothetical protein